MAAIRILGRRIFQIMLYSILFPSRRKIIFKIFGIEISTFPVLIFKTVITQNAASSTRNTDVYRLLRRKFS